MQIRDEILKRAALPLLKPGSNCGISEFGVDGVYDSLFAQITGASYHWNEEVEHSEIRQSGDQYELWGRGMLLAKGSETELTRAHLILSQLASDLKAYVAEETYAQWRDTADKLRAEKRALDTSREQLIRQINSFCSIPVVPGECKYIRWALSKR